MSKFSIPLLALLALTACDSNQGVRITRNAELETDSNASKALKVISALQCPATQGTLTRVGSASVDGKTCTYTGPRGSEVQLHLVSLAGTTSTAALEVFAKQLAPTAFSDTSESSSAISVESRTSPDGTEEARVRAPGVDVRANNDDATVKLPGVSVESKGDTAKVRIPGMSIESEGENAKIRIGGIVINSDGNGSTITDREGNFSVKADDTGAIVHSQSRSAVRATMIHSVSPVARDGWRVVGYEARGPSGGPIVVATFRTRDRDEEAIVDSVRELVVLNVGD